MHNKITISYFYIFLNLFVLNIKISSTWRQEKIEFDATYIWIIFKQIQTKD